MGQLILACLEYLVITTPFLCRELVEPQHLFYGTVLG